MAWRPFQIVGFALLFGITKMDSPKRRSSHMLATKGYRLKGHILLNISVTSSLECAQRCLLDQRCESLNYRHPNGDTPKSCELSSSTKEKNEAAMFVEDASATYYHMMAQVPGGKGTPTVTPTTKGPPPVFKSCLDVQTYNNSRTDGEYPLQIGYPSCNQTVQIYCANMNTSQPLEYLTLAAGADNNFSKKDYVGTTKATSAGSSKTTFSKIRIKSDLTVVRGDYRFASIVWYNHKSVYYPYAAAGDCHAYSCTTTKNGIFKMDLTGTGMRFVTPIDWSYTGYRACSGNTPNAYTVSSAKQRVSGRCGGYCGDCAARSLVLKPINC